MRSWPEGEWALAQFQRRMMQDEVKIVSQNVAPWEKSIFLRGKVDLFNGGWVSCCWVQHRDVARWSKTFMPRCSALKNQHLSERKGWALYRRVSELLLSLKKWWPRMKWKFYAEVQHPEKRSSSWEERLSTLPEGDWAVAESQNFNT